MKENDILQAQDVRFRYDTEQPNFAVDGVSMEVHRGEFVAVLGANGCGKSTLAKHFNAILLPESGTVLVEDMDTRTDEKLYDIRQKVGMVFQKPNPFPKSIFENVAYGLRVNGIKDRALIAERVERSLQGAALWNEVKDKLKKSAFELSGGQQQRLCIARALAVEPSILLMDEPASALDPISTTKIEDLIYELKKEYTIVIVTHNMQQAARVSDRTAFFYLGELIEYDDTQKIFVSPTKEATQNYVTGRFG